MPTSFPTYEPHNWVFDQVAYQFPPPPEELKEWQRDAHKERPKSWFSEYVHYDEVKGQVTFEIHPPFIRQGRIEKLRGQIQDLYNAYRMLFQDSIRSTIQSCYQNLSRRDLRPDLFQIPWSPHLLGVGYLDRKILFLGAEVVKVSPEAFVGALTPEAFCQYEPLPFESACWEWYDEGPLAILGRFV